MSESDCRTTVVLPVDLREQLAEHARAADRSLSAEIPIAVREHITRPTSSARAASQLLPSEDARALGTDNEAAA